MTVVKKENFAYGLNISIKFSFLLWKFKLQFSSMIYSKIKKVADKKGHDAIGVVHIFHNAEGLGGV